MPEQSRPVLYSFRRCPYAMRARLAIAASGKAVTLREVILRDKPAEMIEASPKATVPVLVLEDSQVLEESLDVMNWALSQSDPEGWHDFPSDTLARMDNLVAEADGDFKSALDRYKYPNRYEGVDPLKQRELGSRFIRKLDEMLEGQSFLLGDRFSFADAAILPFVRQFAHVDLDWFRAENWHNVIVWLDGFLESERFKSIMMKYPQWKTGEPGVVFGSDG